MRLVTIFCLLLLAFLFHCGDAKAETADNIQFVSLDEVKGKIAAKEDFYLLIGRLDNVDTQNALDRLSQIDQVIYCLDTKDIDYVAYKKFAKKYNIRTMTHLTHFRGKYQFAVANVLTADLAGFFAV
ncbi:hypothetical protein KJW57_05175 [Streptococcus lutetiensis]|uniref:hypothetical protein n=1 Tax=Streptococcus lutetiensis TaxID=150055 RepID=UPI001BDA0478|nr:hypothetical protein [Streptococcus lutetiensis]MBT0898591.1 hypothetical protein [Streptococcus lutetiensis]MBT0927994.1 hypothetical protein [Streptococcus lutetiensis]MBT1057370.1 hypothetical protein [Streptococcus lutetiensis]MBT1059078.1 hypothetical protein [Streptococcus lutetiensis]